MRRAPTAIERAIIGQQLDVVRYGDDVTREVARLFVETRKRTERLIERAGERGSAFTEEYLRAIQGQIDGILILLRNRTEGVISDAMLAVAEDGFAEASAAFAGERKAAGLDASGAVSIGGDVLLPATRLAEIVRAPIGGRVLADWAERSLGEKMRADIRSSLFASITRGEGIEGAARTLRNELGVHRTRANILARTTLLDVNNRATAEVYRANADVITRYRWLATLDSRTCPICGALDGKESKRYDGFPQGAPPVHPRCRCVVSPVTTLDRPEDRPTRPAVTREEAKTTQHRDGATSTQWKAKATKQVAASVDFPAFFASQPENWQRAYLGKERFALWKTGNLDFSDLTSKDDARILTVAQLRRKVARRRGA